MILLLKVLVKHFCYNFVPSCFPEKVTHFLATVHSGTLAGILTDLLKLNNLTGPQY